MRPWSDQAQNSRHGLAAWLGRPASRAEDTATMGSGILVAQLAQRVNWLGAAYRNLPTTRRAMPGFCFGHGHLTPDASNMKHDIVWDVNVGQGKTPTGGGKQGTLS